MVGVVDAAAAMDHYLGVTAEDRVGLEGPDLPHEHLPQGEVVDQIPVGLVKERDAAIAHDLGRSSLLRLTGAGELEWVDLRVLTACVA
jgi:hypothetical protein